jgi:hypothetical protein
MTGLGNVTDPTVVVRSGGTLDGRPSRPAPR